MKVILMAVISLDGKITKGEEENIYTWTSKEDQKFFFAFLKKHNLIVMGRKTYMAARDKIVLTKGTLRLVMTKNPAQFTSLTVPGQLEFTAESPAQIVKRFKQLGHKKLLVLGGGSVNGQFLQAQVVNELHLTIEPKIFGVGKSISGDFPLDTRLKLLRIKQLNKGGTFHLQYRVVTSKKWQTRKYIINPFIMITQSQAKEISLLLSNNEWNRPGKPYTVYELLQDPEGYFLVTNKNHETIGIAKLKKVQWYQWELGSMSVDVNYRRMGIAESLIKAAEQYVAQHKGGLMQAKIDEKNIASRNLFKKLQWLPKNIFIHPAYKKPYEVWNKSIAELKGVK